MLWENLQVLPLLHSPLRKSKQMRFSRLLCLTMAPKSCWYWQLGRSQRPCAKSKQMGSSPSDTRPRTPRRFLSASLPSACAGLLLPPDISTAPDTDTDGACVEGACQAYG